MSKNVGILISDALVSVQARPDHWLLPLLRRQIYEALDLDPSSRRTHVREWLDCSTARFVLPLWESIRLDPVAVWAEDYDVPKTMVDFADGILRGTGDQVKARKYFEQQAEVAAFSGEAESSRFYHAWCVYRAALTALGSALGIDHFAYAKIIPETTSLRGYDADTANWAVISFAGGVWVRDANAPHYDDYRDESGYWNYDLPEVLERRLEFWRWWLTQALPSAQQMAQSQQP